MISSIIAPMKPPSGNILERRGMIRAALLALFLFAAVYPQAVSAGPSKTEELDYRRMMLKNDHIQAGNIYYRIEMYEKSVDQFERALEIDPQDKKVASLLESAKKKMGIALRPVSPREAEKSPAPVEPQAKEPVEPPAKETVEPPAKKPVEPPAKAPVEPPAKESVKPSAEPPVRAAAPDKPQSAPSPVPGKAGSAEPVVVNGDKVEYFHAEKRVVGAGNVTIEYRDVFLTCEKITVYLDTREAIAEGNVKVAQKGAFFTGDKVSYNFDTRQALVIDGYLNANPFFGKAKEVVKVANKDQFNLDYGYMTTCDLDKPHYRIQSRKVKIYLGDKVVAHHIFLFAGKVPILYFPYYVQPLNERKTHITVIPGESKEWGYYALTSFRYYLDEKNKGDILLDYRSKNGLAAGINHYYTVPNMGTGALKVYYADDNGPAAYERSTTEPERTRYRYQVRHDWDMGGGANTKVTFELNKLSDPDVIKDYFYNEYEELGTLPDNYLSIITQKNEYSTEFLVTKRFDNFYDVVEKVPEYKFDIPNLRLLKDQPIYYKLNSSAVYLNHTYASTVYSNNTLTNVTPPPHKDIGVVRVDAYNQISYAARVFRALNLTPYAGVEETYYSRNIWGDTNPVRGIFKAGLDASIKFYKIYEVTSNFMGLDINNIRHVITPTANYYYTHQPTISKDNLNQFDAIDALVAQNGVLLGLENRLQTKRLEGGQMKSVDLATLYITSNWVFTLDDGKTSFKSGKFENLDFELDLIPYSWAYLVAKASVNTTNAAMQTSSIDLVSAGGDKWNLSAGYRYEKDATGLINLFTMDGMYKISEKWRVRAYERFNIKSGFFEEQEYTVSRDLHCWMAEFTYNYKNNGDQSLWFVMKLKAFPDYPVGLKRTYARPRFGSASYQP